MRKVFFFFFFTIKLFFLILDFKIIVIHKVQFNTLLDLLPFFFDLTRSAQISITSLHQGCQSAPFLYIIILILLYCIKFLFWTIILFLPLYTPGSTLVFWACKVTFSLKNLAKAFGISLVAMGIPAKVRLQGMLFTTRFLATFTAFQRLPWQEFPKATHLTLFNLAVKKCDLISLERILISTRCALLLLNPSCFSNLLRLLILVLILGGWKFALFLQVDSRDNFLEGQWYQRLLTEHFLTGSSMTAQYNLKT